MTQLAPAQSTLQQLSLPQVTTRDALIAAIKAAPADNLPRLVYADYLEGNGDPERASFIRVQVALTNCQTGGPAERSLRAEERR